MQRIFLYNTRFIYEILCLILCHTYLIFSIVSPVSDPLCFAFFLLAFHIDQNFHLYTDSHLAAILVKQVDAIAKHIFIFLIVSLLDILLLLVCDYVYYLIIIIADI